MFTSRIKPLLRRIKYYIRKHPDRFMYDVSGVVHIGANTGQERGVYERLGLRVLWVEPIPDIFGVLQENIRHLRRQRAVCALVTDVDQKSYEFHVANNQGASSSILKLEEHKGIWPEVEFVDSLLLQSTTLPALLVREDINPSEYQGLIIDTQGAELLVLRGSIPILRNFKYIKTEVADFESYKDCCKLADLTKFMLAYRFREFSRRRLADHPNGGSYFDIVWKRV